MLTTTWTGHATFGRRALGQVSAFSSPEEVKTFVDQFLAWMVESEASVLQWHNAILHQIVLGVANCAEVQNFNSQSIKLFELQSLFLEKLRVGGVSEALRKAGAPNLPADPPFPPLFAHDAGVRFDPQTGTEFIKADLKCLPDGSGRIDMKGLKISGPGGRVCPTDIERQRAGLNGAAALCLAGPWVFLGCTIGAIIVIGGAHLLLSDTKDIMRVFSGADKDALQNAMATIIGQKEAKAQEALNGCINKALRDLPANQDTVENRIKLMEQCRAGQRETKREPPKRAFPFIGWLVIGAVAIGGTALGVRHFRKRRVA
jgi:hypothetical protein